MAEVEAFFAAQSCGKCPLCRAETQFFARATGGLRDNKGVVAAHLDKALELATAARSGTDCALARFPAAPLQTGRERFPGDFAAHLAGQSCGKAHSGERLAGAGLTLALVDVDGAGAERALDEIGAKGVAVAADLSVPADLGRAVAEVDDRLGPVDVLVNNAGISGIGPPKPTAETPLDEWEKTLAVNVTAPFLLCRAIVPAMVERGRGVIVNVASMAGVLCLPGRVSYAASKAVLISLTRTLAAETARSGVRVNAICPGWIETPFVAARMAQPELRAAAEAMVPMGRIATPDEVTDTVMFLLSPGSRYMTGVALPVDGGMGIL